MPQKSPWLRDIPSPKEILKIALKKLSFTDPAKTRGKKPHTVVAALESTCHKIYSEHEVRVREEFRKGKYGKIDSREFETSLANSRRKRAGVTLELIFRRMLKLSSVPHEKPKELGEAEFDFVVPDMITLKSDATKAVLISLKRKVRERWKLTVGDAYILREIYKYPNNLWFVSLFDPPVDAVRVFLKLKIRVFVPDGSFDNIVKQLNDLKREELSRLRPFSKVFVDLSSFKTSVQKKLNDLIK